MGSTFLIHYKKHILFPAKELGFFSFIVSSFITISYTRVPLRSPYNNKMKKENITHFHIEQLNISLYGK